MDILTQQWTSAPVWIKFVTLAALPTTGYAIARFLDEYRDWRNVGPGGLPYNIRGFVMNLLLTGVLAKKETKSLEMYGQPEKYATGWKQATEDERKKAKQSFLKTPLRQREGRESNAMHFVAPQRERNIDDLKYIELELMEVSIMLDIRPTFFETSFLTNYRRTGTYTSLLVRNIAKPSNGKRRCSRSKAKPCFSRTPTKSPRSSRNASERSYIFMKATCQRMFCSRWRMRRMSLRKAGARGIGSLVRLLCRWAIRYCICQGTKMKLR